jgi:hypothetical protein
MDMVVSVFGRTNLVLPGGAGGPDAASG